MILLLYLFVQAAATVLISRDEDSYSTDSGSYHSGDEDRRGLRSTVAVVQNVC